MCCLVVQIERLLGLALCVLFQSQKELVFLLKKQVFKLTIKNSTLHDPVTCFSHTCQRVRSLERILIVFI